MDDHSSLETILPSADRGKHLNLGIERVSTVFFSGKAYGSLA